MIEQLKEFGNWFLKQTKTNQIAVLLLGILSVAYFDRADFKKELQALKYDRKRNDSTYVARIDNLNRDFQIKINECNKEKNRIYYEQNEVYRKKFEEVFLKTDFIYQQEIQKK
ncbi:hypothetical protein [Bizionia myxarmorum]|uniref:Uncharacterized protein n=1 Tax=Bizionia myxarmorum TaxID=291186 RepID=A0A5D0RB78_9FLAO|nr:hypothetical protein [Bizionia myxarmorum]TYB78339.1 hypothetical protein ES674_00735 [Bizionia myxarmorum]